MQNNFSKDETLKNSLRTILDQEELGEYQDLVKHLSTELQISYLDCAAALSLLNQRNLSPKKQGSEKSYNKNKNSELLPVFAKQKLVKYRLDIGRKHQVSLNEVKNVLVEVSGVDRMRIGKLDIRNYYTLVELPDGMPADIFQLLSETEFNQQKLNIKRIKYQRKFYRRSDNK